MYEHKFSFLIGNYPGVGLLGWEIGLNLFTFQLNLLNFIRSQKHFLKCVYHFAWIHGNTSWLCILLSIWYCQFFSSSLMGGCGVSSCGLGLLSWWVMMLSQLSWVYLPFVIFFDEEPVTFFLPVLKNWFS